MIYGRDLDSVPQRIPKCQGPNRTASLRRFYQVACLSFHDRTSGNPVGLGDAAESCSGFEFPLGRCHGGRVPYETA